MTELKESVAKVSECEVVGNAVWKVLLRLCIFCMHS